MKGDIHYTDCGDYIWMSKRDWEKLKLWFKTNPGGQELEEYSRRPTISNSVRMKSKP
jgi:hypothetical protein